MKKILISTLLLIAVILTANNVLAATTGNITLSVSKSTVKVQEEFTVILKATDSNNLNTVEYSGIKVTDDKGNVSNAITLKSVDEMENWAEMSYDGKTAFVYSGDSATQSQDFCKLTFTVEDNATAGKYNINIEGLTVYSTNLQDDTTTIGNKVVAIEIEAEKTDDGNNGDSTGDNTVDNTGDNAGDNKGDNTNKGDNKLPQTGMENGTVIGILIVSVIGTVSYLSYRKYGNIK